MNKSDIIKKNLTQIIAITEKNTKLRLRYKYGLIISFIIPIFTIIMPLIILGRIFDYNEQFGPWNGANYLAFLFIAYNILLLKDMIKEIPGQLRHEKFWETLPSLIIAPFNRFNLLLGMFLSHIIVILIPFTIFFILCYFIYPISFLTLLFVIEIYFLIAIVFSGIGLILGIFAVSNENILKLFIFSFDLIFWFSCVTYPFEIFPELIQQAINLNPLYYIFDLVRLGWIENNFILTITSHPLHLLIIITCAIIIPCIGVYVFNMIYKKYGIVGY